MFRPNKLLLPLIALFTLTLAAQLATGVALFYLKWGLSLSSITEYYMGEAGGRGPLSWFRLLETAVPHLVAMATVGFILCHFLAFVEDLKPKTQIFLSGGLFFSLFFNISADFILRLWPQLAAMKLISFLLFQFFFFVVGFIILKASIPSAQRQSFVKSTKV